ncbi:MAG: FAD-dependent oxidoreductase, partial [Akkermansiaceae bacterium]
MLTRCPLLALALALPLTAIGADSLLVEAEAFQDIGGWKRDTQFVLSMGSPYLLAHGLGTRVNEAKASVTFPSTGKYHMWVRSKNWVGPWDAEGEPGRFTIELDDARTTSIFGRTGVDWRWEKGPHPILIEKEVTTISLLDLTGFDGRCDAIFFTKDPVFTPPNDPQELLEFRRKHLGLPAEPPTHGPYDLVVIGGGYSGLGAAVAAARQGCKVALIQDRPVLGGNGSSEVRVWAKGGTRRGKYPRLGEIIEEFADHAKDSPGRAPEFTDARKETTVRAEKTIDLYLNHFA